MHKWQKDGLLDDISKTASSVRATCINEAPYLDTQEKRVSEIRDRVRRLELLVHVAGKVGIGRQHILEAISFK